MYLGNVVQARIWDELDYKFHKSILREMRLPVPTSPALQVYLDKAIKPEGTKRRRKKLAILAIATDHGLIDPEDGVPVVVG